MQTELHEGSNRPTSTAPMMLKGSRVSGRSIRESELKIRANVHGCTHHLSSKNHLRSVRGTGRFSSSDRRELYAYSLQLHVPYTYLNHFLDRMKEKHRRFASSLSPLVRDCVPCCLQCKRATHRSRWREFRSEDCSNPCRTAVQKTVRCS